MADTEMNEIDTKDQIIDEKIDNEHKNIQPRNIFISLLWRLNFAAYTMEFIGTFMLTLIVALTANTSNQPLAIGASLSTLVFLGGHISGGHYNPGVSLSIFLRQKLTFIDLVLYFIVQFSAGLIGSFCAYMISPSNSNFLGPKFGVGVGIFQAFFSEFLFSFYLSFTVLNVATVKKKEGNSFYGLAIGFAVLGGAFSSGYISGAALNPAVALGRSVIKAVLENDGSHLEFIWLYLTAPWIGSLFAATMFFFNKYE